MEKQVVQFQFGSEGVTLETGAIARQATGAVVITMGETQILATVVGAKKCKTRSEIFPSLGALSGKNICRRKDPGWLF